MTDKEFVQTIYPNATCVYYNHKIWYIYDGTFNQAANSSDIITHSYESEDDCWYWARFLVNCRLRDKLEQ